MNALPAFKSIKAFFFDMDGVLTDGGLFVEEDSRWLRRMDIKDGYALQLATRLGYDVVVVSGSNSNPVAERLRKLGITEIFMGISDKKSFVTQYMVERKWLTQTVLYMGDDIPDYDCMNLAGISCCPSDAVTEIKKISTYVSNKAGGYGCVRDVIEKVLKLNNHWPLHTQVSSI